MTNEVANIAQTAANGFWGVHGIWFLIFMALFPRLTMLFTKICFMGFAHPVLFWIGWVISPRLVAAILATTFYWTTNPVLCVITWMIALSGDCATKNGASQMINQHNQHGSRHARWRSRQRWI